MSKEREITKRDEIKELILDTARGGIEKLSN